MLPSAKGIFFTRTPFSMKAYPESSNNKVEPLNHANEANDPLLHPGTRSLHCRDQTIQMCVRGFKIKIFDVWWVWWCWIRKDSTKPLLIIQPDPARLPSRIPFGLDTQSHSSAWPCYPCSSVLKFGQTPAQTDLLICNGILHPGRSLQKGRSIRGQHR